jgi:hypothetical protein
MTIINLATPKAGAKHELLFNKPASGLHTTSKLFEDNISIGIWLSSKICVVRNSGKSFLAFVNTT